MATATKTLITADEFMKMDLGEGTFELVRGEVVQMPPPGPEHGIVCGNTYYALSTFGRQTGHGYALTNDSALRTERDPDTVRGADVCYYSQARLPRSELGSGVPPVPPDVAVEVLSPSDRPGEIRAKIYEYLEAGVPLVWVVDPARRTLAIYRPDELLPAVHGNSDEVAELPGLPGFRCRVSDLFA